ncbi:hypothetical protein [Chromobacterium sp. IIBBL 290-4]|uniref:hypothetical protein n=1 Tax=Chromobacterium sp. IIBBL 290-4 TaxID=2953890 RepID=UPI0020B658A6|nr:hypothetical protein [Chromobacterium sp. IIBBL 290-4]UTH74201.1 hypothetical protein NKT35_22120 [Chromobacterium sp. IIBBL 290-4]
MSKTQSISIQVQKNDEDFLQAMRAETEIGFVELETSSFDGQSEITTVVVTLTPLVIGLIGRIVSQQLKARRYIKVVYKGLQIQGLSDENATRLIEKLIDKQ